MILKKKNNIDWRLCHTVQILFIFYRKMMNLNNKTAIDPQFDSRVQMFHELELMRVTIYGSLPGASWSPLYIYVAVFQLSDHIRDTVGWDLVLSREGSEDKLGEVTQGGYTARQCLKRSGSTGVDSRPLTAHCAAGSCNSPAQRNFKPGLISTWPDDRVSWRKRKLDFQTFWVLELW